jgi:5'-3' exonuclease
MDFKTVPENSAKILVDIRGLLYNSFFWAKKHYDVGVRQEMESAMLHQVFSKLKLAMKTARTNRLIFCCDSATSKRKELYPEYKGRRTKDEDFINYKDFFLRIQNEVIPSMGFANVLEAQGLEADDIIASICAKEKKLPILILSDDADLYQCVKDNVYMMAIRSNSDKPQLMTPAKFTKLFGLPPNRWADVKALAGCGTDNIPGIPGVGEGKALAYLLGTLPQKGIVYKRIQNSKDIIDFTDKLVRLPFNGQILDFQYEDDEFNIDYIVKLINEYSLLSLETPFWEGVFK